MEKRGSVGTVVARGLFCIYCAAMLWLLFGQRIGAGADRTYAEQLHGNLNLIPFKTIIWFATVGDKTSNQYLLQHAFVNLAGNVVLFIPMGFFLPCIWSSMRAFWKLLLCFTGLILAVELLQLITLLGSCDIDDLILNVFGAMLGYGLWKLSAVYGGRQKPGNSN